MIPQKYSWKGFFFGGLVYPGDTLSDGIVVLNFFRPCILQDLALISSRRFLHRFFYAHISALLKNTKANAVGFYMLSPPQKLNCLKCSGEPPLIFVQLLSCCCQPRAQTRQASEKKTKKQNKTPAYKKRGQNCTFKLNCSIFLPPRLPLLNFILPTSKQSTVET